MWWAKAHAIPVARYLGRGSKGTATPRKEPEAENEGIRIPSTIRWLCGAPSVKTRYDERTISASSVVLAFANKDTFRLVCKKGLRLQGRRYEVETYEEVRPDVGCGHCAGWGHIEPQCSRTTARCGWCAEQHKMREHRRLAEGCRAKQGHWCQHTVAKCANCRGPTSRRRGLTQGRGRPAVRRRGGGPPPPSGGSEARPRCQKTYRPAPRRYRVAGRRWKRSTSPPQGRPWRSRATGRFGRPGRS